MSCRIYLSEVALNKIVYQVCKVPSHNKPIGLIGKSESRPESEVLSAIKDDSKCEFCSLHVSFIEQAKTKSFKAFYKSEGQKEELPNDCRTFLGKTLTIMVFVMALLTTLYKVSQNPMEIIEKRYWEYLTPLSISIVAFASISDKNSTRFVVFANLFAAIIATCVLFAGYLNAA
ncbi:hypothetical protein [Aeromonas veronii]|uniref:hypothetical protein n=1 Tax=Aeromonas veronii TaxID=654 RepID=UPI003007B673